MYINPFKILVDRAERPAYAFKNFYSDKTSPGKGQKMWIPCQHVVLQHGDYTIEGHKGGVAVERKTVNDFVQSLTSRHKWFRDKTAKMNDEVEAPFIVVEGTIEKIAKHCKSVDVYLTISRTMISWTYRFPNVHWFLLADRRSAEVCTFRLMERWWKIKTGEVDALP